MASLPDIIGNQYRPTAKLGCGAFGNVFKAHDIYTRKKVAIKLESGAATGPSIASEARILNDLGPAKGLPKLICHGIYKNQHFLVLELLGLSLKKHMKRRGQFSLKSVLMVGLQLVDRLEFIHKHGILHRDIKPDNCLLGRKNPSVVYLVDFGLSKKFRVNGMHMPYREGKRLTGTAHYASISVQLGIENSRRDDIESLGYLLVALLYGRLPWQHISSKRVKNAAQRVCQIKMSGSLHRLCPNLPPQVDAWVSYARGLAFEAEPDYPYLRRLLESAAEAQKLRMDNVFDWVRRRSSKSRRKPSVEEGRVETQEAQEFPEFKHPEATIKVFNQLKKQLSTRQSSLNST